MARPLSENGQLIAIMLIVPLLWPFLPVVLLCMMIEKVKYWRYRRVAK